MPAVPDDKDWTWVLKRCCPECAFDVSALPREHIAPLVRATALIWTEVLGSPDPGLRERPSDDRWSALEYGCHVRDVFTLYDERLELMLREHDPAFANWDQDETAVTARYDEQVPSDVSVQLAAAASALADRFDTVTGDQWTRTGTRGDGAHFTIETFGRYMLHDPVHHLHDVGARLPDRLEPDLP